MRRIIAVVIACSVLSCKQEVPVDKKAEGEKVMQVSKDWSALAATADMEKSLGYWSDDAVLISPAHPQLNGKKEIKAMVEGAFKIPGFAISWQPKTVEVSHSGDMAYTLEDSQMTFTDSTGKAITQHSKAVKIWRKQSDGSWKNVVEISTPDKAQGK